MGLFYTLGLFLVSVSLRLSLSLSLHLESPQNAIITLSAEIYFLPPRGRPAKMIYFRITGIYFPFAGEKEAENRPILLQLPKNGDRFISLPRPFLPPPPRQIPRRT